MNKLQRSFGELDIKFRNNDIIKLFQKGASKAIIPNVDDALQQMILINTAGGITSGDNYSTSIELDNSSMCTSTQAAEKIYKGISNPGIVDVEVNLKNNSNMYWLPQEMILFNNCNIRRKININIEDNSNFLMSESIVFGRTSMKEKFTTGLYSDFWKIHKNKKLVHVEASNTNGYTADIFAKAATFNKNCAINIIIGIGDLILKKGEIIKNNLKNSKMSHSEVSIWDEKLIIRTISIDNYHLRFALENILSYFFRNSIPKIWSI